MNWFLAPLLVMLVIPTSVLAYLMRNQVNAKLKHDEQIPVLLYGWVFWEMIGRHRELYPKSDLRLVYWILVSLLVLVGLCMVFVRVSG